MALHGDGSADPDFDSVASAAQARALFERDFADALPLIPELEHDFETNPTGTLAHLYLDRWHLAGNAVMLGAAAHAMLPFHGQRSEARRVGKECVSTCISRWSPSP